MGPMPLCPKLSDVATIKVARTRGRVIRMQTPFKFCFQDWQIELIHE